MQEVVVVSVIEVALFQHAECAGQGATQKAMHV